MVGTKCNSNCSDLNKNGQTILMANMNSDDGKLNSLGVEKIVE